MIDLNVKALVELSKYFLQEMLEMIHYLVN